jgi:DNA-binding LacI/PurR family transcriptional regulator
VSRQTVSNALNAPHLVRPDTLARVMAVVQELGYRPHHAARKLRTRRSQLIGVRMETIQAGTAIGVVLDRFLHALLSQAQDIGHRLIPFTAPDDEQETTLYHQLLSDHDLDAFVLTGTHLGDARTAWLAERRVPFVTFGRPWGEKHPLHGWVDVDGAAGTEAATAHLSALGHRRIGFLGWSRSSEVGEDRRAGWARACAAAAILSPDLEVHLPDTLVHARESTAALLDLADPPTAFVCASDSLALGAWAEVTARGLAPGRDVAVIGFDDSPAAGAVGLSSVAQPLDEAAAACLVVLQSVISAKSPLPTPPEPILLTPQLVTRVSG